MLTAAVLFILTSLCYIEAYCVHTLVERYKWLSNKRMQERRAYYRNKAYKIVGKEYAINRNRNAIWEHIEK